MEKMAKMGKMVLMVKTEHQGIVLNVQPDLQDLQVHQEMVQIVVVQLEKMAWTDKMDEMVSMESMDKMVWMVIVPVIIP